MAGMTTLPLGRLPKVAAENLAFNSSLRLSKLQIYPLSPASSSSSLHSPSLQAPIAIVAAAAPATALIVKKGKSPENEGSQKVRNAAKAVQPKLQSLQTLPVQRIIRERKAAAASKGGPPRLSKAARRFYNETFRQPQRLSKVLAAAGDKGKDKLPVEESSSSTRRHRRETAAADTQFMASARTARDPRPSMTAEEQEENDLFTAQLMSMMGTFEQLAKNPRMQKLLKTKDYRTGLQAETSQQATSRQRQVTEPLQGLKRVRIGNYRLPRTLGLGKHLLLTEANVRNAQLMGQPKKDEAKHGKEH
ncbi:hypothetical protein L7F22_056148 [Adiantum nelumboides]|nr:hypothetical protein [Adiantum nelumboides]